jgi:hypothetical protein
MGRGGASETVSFASCSGRLHRIVFESRWLYWVFRELMGHLNHRNETCDVDTANDFCSHEDEMVC